MKQPHGILPCLCGCPGVLRKEYTQDGEILFGVHCKKPGCSYRLGSGEVFSSSQNAIKSWNKVILTVQAYRRQLAFRRLSHPNQTLEKLKSMKAGAAEKEAAPGSPENQDCSEAKAQQSTEELSESSAGAQNPASETTSGSIPQKNQKTGSDTASAKRRARPERKDSSSAEISGANEARL